MIHKTILSNASSLQMIKQIDLDVGVISDINVSFNAKRNFSYVFLMYQEFPKTIMFTVDLKNKMRTYEYKQSYTNSITCAISEDRWIYFIETMKAPFAINNIIRVYDKAIQQSDLIFEIDLKVVKTHKKNYKFNPSILEDKSIKIETSKKIRDLSKFETLIQNSSFDDIALELEYQFIDIDRFIYKDNSSVNYNTSWVSNTAQKIDSTIQFPNKFKPYDASLSFENSSHYLFVSYPRFPLTEYYELDLVTKFKEKEYHTPMTIQISKWNVTNWNLCRGTTNNTKCDMWKSGYVPIKINDDEDKCKKVFSTSYAATLFKILKVVSATTTVCLIILLIKRAKLLMHIAIYFENKLLFIFITQFYYHVWYFSKTEKV